MFLCTIIQTNYLSVWFWSTGNKYISYFMWIFSYCYFVLWKIVREFHHDIVWMFLFVVPYTACWFCGWANFSHLISIAKSYQSFSAKENFLHCYLNFLECIVQGSSTAGISKFHYPWVLFQGINSIISKVLTEWKEEFWVTDNYYNSFKVIFVSEELLCLSFV